MSILLAMEVYEISDDIEPSQDFIIIVMNYSKLIAVYIVHTGGGKPATSFLLMGFNLKIMQS